MSTLQTLGVVALAVMVSTPEAMAQRGGAVRSGMRGAVVGGMVGGEAGAQTGAKVGAVAGATRGVAQRTASRNAMNAESQTRAQYQSTPAYQSAPRSNFNQAPPEVIVSKPPAGPAAPGKESIIRQNGKPVVGISYPDDWKQKVGDFYVSAVSADGQAYSAIATMDDVKDKQAGIAKVKQGFDRYLENIEYDEPTTTKDGSLAITGTGKAKKAGVDVVFAAVVFDAGAGKLAGVAFVADKDVEDHYKETSRYICHTIRTEKDFEQAK
jgi:uncharacterized protein YcfJ